MSDQATDQATDQAAAPKLSSAEKQFNFSMQQIHITMYQMLANLVSSGLDGEVHIDIKVAAGKIAHKVGFTSACTMPLQYVKE